MSSKSSPHPLCATQTQHCAYICSRPGGIGGPGLPADAVPAVLQSRLGDRAGLRGAQQGELVHGGGLVQGRPPHRPQSPAHSQVGVFTIHQCIPRRGAVIRSLHASLFTLVLASPIFLLLLAKRKSWNYPPQDAQGVVEEVGDLDVDVQVVVPVEPDDKVRRVVVRPVVVVGVLRELPLHSRGRHDGSEVVVGQPSKF